MNRILQILTLSGFFCFTTSVVSAQTSNSQINKMGEFDEIVIKRNNNSADAKITIEIINDDILVNGKKLDQFSDANISVFRKKIIPLDGNAYGMNDRSYIEGEYRDENNGTPVVKNKAFLGVISKKNTAAGCTVISITSNSPAEKAGLKTGDVITSIDNIKVNNPAELAAAIGKYQPGNKVTITYVRNKMTTKATATLDKWKDIGMPGTRMNPFPPFPPDDENIFSFPPSPRYPQGFGNLWHNDKKERVKLGLQVQDTENDEGAQVMDVATASPAEKAGFKIADVITDLGGTPVKTAKDLFEAYRENHGKKTIVATVKRNNQMLTLEISVPKKLNKVDL